jgi:hypothetical protein
MTFLFYLAGWAEAWSASGNTILSMTFEMGPADRSKRAAWSTIEGAAGAGQITVWDSGECQLEVYATDTGAPIINEALLLTSVEALGSTLRRALAECSA